MSHRPAFPVPPSCTTISAANGEVRNESDDTAALDTIRQQIVSDETLRPEVEWTTLVLAAGLLVAITVSIASAIIGLVPLWLAGLINVILFYCCQIAVHEAAHFNIVRRGRFARFCNAAIGYLFAGILFWDFRTFRHLHLKHHRHTNDAESDPDYLPAGSGLVARLVRAVLFLAIAFAQAARDVLSPALPQRQRWRIATSWCVFYGLALAVCLSAPTAALSLWVGPAIAATALLMLAHWSLHTETRDASQLAMTRVFRAEGWRDHVLSAAFLGQQHHLVHHLFPFVAFHRMAIVAKLLVPLYDRAGVEVVRFGSGPSRVAGGKGQD